MKTKEEIEQRICELKRYKRETDCKAHVYMDKGDQGSAIREICASYGYSYAIAELNDVVKLRCGRI